MSKYLFYILPIEPNEIYGVCHAIRNIRYEENNDSPIRMQWTLLMMYKILKNQTCMGTHFVLPGNFNTKVSK